MKIGWIFLMSALCLKSHAFLYPEQRRVIPGIMLHKHKDCHHDCSNVSLLNQHDAYRCTKACRTH